MKNTISGFSISGWRQSHVWTKFSSGLERYGGINFRRKYFETWLGSEPFSWLSTDFRSALATGFIILIIPTLATRLRPGSSVTLKPRSNLRISYNLMNEEFYKKKGEKKNTASTSSVSGSGINFLGRSLCG